MRSTIQQIEEYRSKLQVLSEYINTVEIAARDGDEKSLKILGELVSSQKRLIRKIERLEKRNAQEEKV